MRNNYVASTKLHIVPPFVYIDICYNTETGTDLIKCVTGLQRFCGDIGIVSLLVSSQNSV